MHLNTFITCTPILSRPIKACQVLARSHLVIVELYFFPGFFCVLRDTSSKMTKWHLIGHEIHKYVPADACNHFVLFLAGSDLHRVDSLGKSALMIGLQEGAERSCLYLIKAGSDVNMTDHEGHSVLFYSVHSSYLHTLDVAKKLIKAGKLSFCPTWHFN